MTPGHEDRGPDPFHAAPARKGPDEPERDEQREERELAPDHGRQCHLIQARYFRQRDDRRSQCAVGHRSRVGDQGQTRCSERRKTETDQNCAGHSHRRAEAGRALEKCAERECNQEELQASILAHVRNTVLQDLEVPFVLGKLVEEDDVEHDPADRQAARTKPPRIAASPAMLAGMLNTRTATSTALSNPRIAAQWAAIRKNARLPRSTTTGIAARIVDSHGFRG